MAEKPPDSIPNLLIKSIPRQLILGIEEALLAGAQRAFSASKWIAPGHLAHALGQLRHFHMNEAFHSALLAGDAEPTEINGNHVISGRAGKFKLARFNTRVGVWIHGRRSETRRRISKINAALEPLVSPDLFHRYVEPAEATAFFVCCFSGSIKYQPESPLGIQIAVPDSDMRGWLFREPIHAFLNRYYQGSPVQVDGARPRLRSIKKRNQNGNAS